MPCSFWRGASRAEVQEAFMPVWASSGGVTRVRIAAAAVLSLGALSGACGGAGTGDPPAPRAGSKAGAPSPTLVVRRAGRLPAPVQLPAATTLPGGRTLLLGGLNAAGASSDRVVMIGSSGAARTAGTLSAPVHDAAAATLGGHAYLFGGGDATPRASILRVGSSGHAAINGRPAVGASGQCAATIGNRTYVVGGYDGSAPLRSIVAFSPGRAARVVATLPRPLRYASVAAIGRFLVIAGGTSGTTAQRAVLRFDPATHRVTRIGSLPRPLT